MLCHGLNRSTSKNSTDSFRKEFPAVLEILEGEQIVYAVPITSLNHLFEELGSNRFKITEENNNGRLP